MDVMDGGDSSGLVTVGTAVGLAAAGNPLSADDGDAGAGSSEKGENNELTAVVMPDLFERVRPLVCKDDGSPRLLVWLMPWSWLVIGVLTMPLSAHWTDCGQCEDEEASGRSVPHALNGIAFTLAGSAPAAFTLQFAEAIAPLKTGGALARLGAGSKKVSEQQLRSVKRWLALAVPFAFLCAIGSFISVILGLLNILGLVSSDSPVSPGQVVGPWVMLCLGVGVPSMLGWYVAMKVGVCLARNEVMSVVERTLPAALADDERWSSDVAQPAVKLATHTMPALSYGFGTGTALVAMVATLMMIFNGNSLLYGFNTGYHIHYTEEDEAGNEVSAAYSDVMAGRHAFNLVMQGLLVPLLLASDLAYVSSQCDRLLNTINNLRLTWESTKSAQEVHSRVYPLLDTLRNLNANQGLGFTAGGKVVDKRTLNVIFVSAVSFFSAVFPLLITLIPSKDQPLADVAGATCNMTAAEVALVRNVFEARGCPMGNATLIGALILS